MIFTSVMETEFEPDRLIETVGRRIRVGDVDPASLFRRPLLDLTDQRPAKGPTAQLLLHTDVNDVPPAAETFKAGPREHLAIYKHRGLQPIDVSWIMSELVRRH